MKRNSRRAARADRPMALVDLCPPPAREFPDPEVMRGLSITPPGEDAERDRKIRHIWRIAAQQGR